MLDWIGHKGLSTFLPLALLVSLATQPRDASGQIVMVVHSDYPQNDISVEIVRRLYTGTVTRLPDGTRVILTEYAPVRAMFYRAVSNMTIDEIRRRWLSIIFSGAGGRPPTEFIDVEELKRFVANTRGALGFMPWSEVDDRVKVLTVDGRAPGDPGYALDESG